MTIIWWRNKNLIKIADKSFNCCCTNQKQKKPRNLYIFVLVVMSLFACTPPRYSLFVINFGYPPPPYDGDVIFEWSLLQFLDLPKECLFEKYSLQLFQNGFEPFSRFNLSKWSFLLLDLVCLVLPHNYFFAFYTLKYLVHF